MLTAKDDQMAVFFLFSWATGADSERTVHDPCAFLEMIILTGAVDRTASAAHLHQGNVSSRL